MPPKFQAYAVTRLLCIALAFFALAPAREAPAQQEIPVPSWFKPSFLDLRDDVKEAAAGGRRVMIYLGQNGCPYCRKLMEVTFRDKDIVDGMHRGIDAIEINIFGSREVTAIDGQVLTEKEFARSLKVRATPTLVFLDEKGSIALRLDGYYEPQRFNTALEYVTGHYESKVGFREFQKTRARGAASQGDEPRSNSSPVGLTK